MPITLVERVRTFS